RWRTDQAVDAAAEEDGTSGHLVPRWREDAFWSLSSLPVDDLPPRSGSSDDIAPQRGDHDRHRRAGMSISPAPGILRWSVVCTGAWRPCQSVPRSFDPIEGVRGKAPDAAQDLTDQSGSQERRTACLVSGATVSEPVLGLALGPAR